ncbi:hypothetical protein N7495_000768 [Penicillium taxi]|uniref:uncharacterized protein n=1 Tax=Penicillium taxi TaxID=168475 RepID=UPI0025454727|nr:uncharacterized protein N7495_000768 [Penicillium taxi]KAJ5908086.1 hypothetical protein N7495_000768 [Penicillium taxi]
MVEIEYPPTKRARRSTKRCHECVRRKVKCQLATEDVAICSECIKTGAQCTLQSPATESLENAFFTNQSDQEERLKRIEQMLHNLVEAQRAQNTQTLLETEFNLQPAVNWTELINENIFPDIGVQPTQFDSFNPSEHLEQTDSNVDIPRKGKTAKESLLKLLPSQGDIINILSHTGAWALELPAPPGSIRSLKVSTQVEARNIDTAPRLSIINIAKTLLFLALCLQQLPPNFDISQFNMDDTEDLVKQYTHSVASLCSCQRR